MSGGPLVAVDGPAGAGKSTVSGLIAERLGVDRLDTGAMYRAVTWLALERGLDPAAPSDRDAVAALAREARICPGTAVTINDVDVTVAIREPGVSRAVSAVAANPDVRQAMVAAQRHWIHRREGAVVEGRDIGTMVLPEADLKIYLTASAEERARRRGEEGGPALARRDRLDSNREASPLAVAPDARVVDTTDRSVDDVVEEILSWL